MTTPATVPLVTNHQDTGELVNLAHAAADRARELQAAARGLIRACLLSGGPRGPADPAAIFSALRVLQADLEDTDRQLCAVLRHATSHHGYY